jgi:anti-sigma factor RsiW
MIRETQDVRLDDGCGAIRPLLVPYLDREVTAAEARGVEGHVASCPRCARDLEVHRNIGDALTAVCVRGSPELASGPAAPRGHSADLACRARGLAHAARARRLVWAARVAALFILACGLLLWRVAPWTRPAAVSEPGEELLGALDVLQALEEEGVEPTPEIAQAILDAASDPDDIDLDAYEGFLPEEVAPENL